LNWSYVVNSVFFSWKEGGSSFGSKSDEEIDDLLVVHLQLD
jgi:hypothetical protein